MLTTMGRSCRQLALQDRLHPLLSSAWRSNMLRTQTLVRAESTGYPQLPKFIPD
jgi:hypothetical protein